MSKNMSDAGPPKLSDLHQESIKKKGGGTFAKEPSVLQKSQSAKNIEGRR